MLVYIGHSTDHGKRRKSLADNALGVTRQFERLGRPTVAEFAFIIHPIDPKRDVERKFPLLGRYLPEPAIHFLSRFFPPLRISRITGVRSRTGPETRGWFVACPFTPSRMMSLPVPVVYRKIVQTGRLAERLGADILGLGAYTSVVGDAGITISQRLGIWGDDRQQLYGGDGCASGSRFG